MYKFGGSGGKDKKRVQKATRDYLVILKEPFQEKRFGNRQWVADVRRTSLDEPIPLDQPVPREQVSQPSRAQNPRFAAPPSRASSPPIDDGATAEAERIASMAQQGNVDQLFHEAVALEKPQNHEPQSHSTKRSRKQQTKPKLRPKRFSNSDDNHTESESPVIGPRPVDVAPVSQNQWAHAVDVKRCRDQLQQMHGFDAALAQHAAHKFGGRLEAALEYCEGLHQQQQQSQRPQQPMPWQQEQQSQSQVPIRIHENHHNNGHPNHQGPQIVSNGVSQQPVAQKLELDNDNLRSQCRQLLGENNDLLNQRRQLAHEFTAHELELNRVKQQLLARLRVCVQ